MEDVIFRNFDLEGSDDASGDGLDEKTLHVALSARIAEMLDFESELLFSTLYRLDVLEYKIKEVLSGITKETIPEGLARLVIERQKEKMKTRKNPGTSPKFEDF